MTKTRCADAARTLLLMGWAVLFVLIGGCASIDDLQDTRNQLAVIHADTAASLAEVRAKVEALPADSPIRAEVQGTLDKIEGQVGRLGDALKQAEAVLAQAKSGDHAGAIERGADIVGGMVGGPWGAGIATLGGIGALVWRLVRQGNAAKSLAQSVQALMVAEPAVAEAIHKKGDLLRAIQTPAARKIVDAVGRTGKGVKA